MLGGRGEEAGRSGEGEVGGGAGFGVERLYGLRVVEGVAWRCLGGGSGSGSGFIGGGWDGGEDLDTLEVGSGWDMRPYMVRRRSQRALLRGEIGVFWDVEI